MVLDMNIRLRTILLNSASVRRAKNLYSFTNRRICGFSLRGEFLLVFFDRPPASISIPYSRSPQETGNEDGNKQTQQVRDHKPPPSSHRNLRNEIHSPSSRKPSTPPPPRHLSNLVPLYLLCKSSTPNPLSHTHTQPTQHTPRHPHRPSELAFQQHSFSPRRRRRSSPILLRKFILTSY